MTTTRVTGQRMMINNKKTISNNKKGMMINKKTNKHATAVHDNTSSRADVYDRGRG